jgi:hypothetical protein
MCLPEYTCQGFSRVSADAHVCFSEWFGQRAELYVSRMLSVWTSLSVSHSADPLIFQHVLILKTFNLGLWPEEAKTFHP